jgi:hypothetical protein
MIEIECDWLINLMKETISVWAAKLAGKIAAGTLNNNVNSKS